MTCTTVSLGNGRTAILCSKGHAPVRRCWFCGRPASYLCDWPMKKGESCSRPLCDGCRHSVVGRLDYCGPHKIERDRRAAGA